MRTSSFAWRCGRLDNRVEFGSVMTQLHFLELDDVTDPMVTVDRTWEGPVLLVGAKGENILAVNTPKRAVVPFFQSDDGEAERTTALVAAAREHADYEPEVHVVSVRKRGEREAGPLLLGMFVAPEKAEVRLSALVASEVLP